MTTVTHDDAFAALPELALDALDGSERAVVLRHVDECLTCRRELEQLRDVVGALGDAAPAAPLPAERCVPMRARLVERAALSRGAAARPQPAGLTPADRWSAGIGRRAAAAVLLLALGAGSIAWWSLQTRNTALERVRRAELAAMEDRQAARRAQQLAEERRALLDALTSPQVTVVSLAAGDRAPSARMFWNRASNRWTLIARDLPRLPVGRAYQLWLITAGERISAGTFVPAPDGSALVQATYELDAGALRAIAVTEEPEGGRPQPTGRVVISGTAE